jgi:hypothetical protein
LRKTTEGNYNMAFQELQKKPRAYGPGAIAPKAVSVTKYKGAVPHFVISSTLAAQLNWTAGQKAVISIGTGPDENWVLIEKAQSGHTMSKTGGTNTRALKIGFTGMFDHIKQANVTPCKFNVVGESLYVLVPERLREKSPSTTADLTPLNQPASYAA